MTVQRIQRATITVRQTSASVEARATKVAIDASIFDLLEQHKAATNPHPEAGFASEAAVQNLQQQIDQIQPEPLIQAAIATHKAEPNAHEMGSINGLAAVLSGKLSAEEFDQHAASYGNGGHIPASGLSEADIPNLPANRITTGTFTDDRIPASIARDSEVSAIASALQIQIDQKEVSGAAVAAVAAHEQASDPHPQYAPAVALSALQAEVVGKQPLDDDLTGIAALSPTQNQLLIRGATGWEARALLEGDIPDAIARDSEVAATAASLQTQIDGKQASDADLSAIAALTTQPFGRSLLTQADAGNTRLTITGNWEFRQTTKPLTRPGGAALVVGDRWWDTSEERWWFWNGVYWLSEQVLTFFIAINTITASAFPGGLPTTPLHNIYLTSFEFSTQLASTSTFTADDRWEIKLVRDSGTNVISDEAAFLLDNYAGIAQRITLRTTLDRHRDVAALNTRDFRIEFTRFNNAPQIVRPSAQFTYRLAKP